jgi:hypothetical protein
MSEDQPDAVESHRFSCSSNPGKPKKKYAGGELNCGIKAPSTDLTGPIGPG